MEAPVGNGRIDRLGEDGLRLAPAVKGMFAVGPACCEQVALLAGNGLQEGGGHIPIGEGAGTTVLGDLLRDRDSPVIHVYPFPPSTADLAPTLSCEDQELNDRAEGVTVLRGRLVHA